MKGTSFLLHKTSRGSGKRLAGLSVFTSLLLALFANSLNINAQEIVDSVAVKVVFPVNKTEVTESYMGNGERLSEFLGKLREVESAPRRKVSCIKIIGYASPEGGYKLNQRLSRKRAAATADYMKALLGVEDSVMEVIGGGIDWQGLDRALADCELKSAPRARYIIRHEPEISYDAKGRITGSRKKTLMDLEGGRAWNWMMKHIYPELRSSASVVCYFEEAVPEPAVAAEPEKVEMAEAADSVASLVLAEEPDTVATGEGMKNPFYMSLHTNMLYDALAVPNLGAEFYLGKNISLAANWWYAWWDTDRRHRYWRTYGGYIAPRYWFGEAARKKPLTGHHVGIYGQIMLYDFEWGGTGYLSGTPGKNIFHHPTWGGGLEYGFALPIGRHLNIDFTIGVGYMQGRYWKYEPMDGHYVWLSTNMRHWFGPTKLEVSLVWLLGRGNVNEKKGGGR